MQIDFNVECSKNATMKKKKHSYDESASILFKAKGIEIIKNASLSAKIYDVKRWMAISRYNTYWMKPSFGTKLSDVPAETQFLLIETIGTQQIVVVPLSYDEYTFAINGGDDDNEICFSQNNYMPVNCEKNKQINVAVFMHDFFNIVNNTDALASLIGKATGNPFRIINEKNIPDFVREIGWCTWDAYYHEVDQEKVIKGIRYMMQEDLPLGYVIIDDGWLDVTGDLLNSFNPNVAKFDKDFNKLNKLCNDFDIDLGVWHAFNGYWGGINPAGELKDEYNLISNENKIRPWEGEKDKPIPLHMIDQREISRFYLDWYRHLYSLGVKMVKVDAQSGLEKFTEGICNRTIATRRYQEAMQAAAGLFFNNSVIHCMSHGSDVMTNMMSTNVIRNSDDYFPGKPVPVQQNHIFVNAINAVYTSMFAIPDWDMFKSGMPEGAFHAAARAISGGPVYICDKPEEVNVDIVKRLITSDGKVLSPLSIAKPLNDRIFNDCMHEDKLLIIRNFTTYGIIFGIFNVNVNGKTITESIDFAEHLPLNMLDESVYSMNVKGTIGKLPENGKMKIKLKPMEYELICFTAPLDGVAPIGLSNKYIGSAAIVKFERSKGVAILETRFGGDLVIYSETIPDAITMNFEEIEFNYNKKDKTITIDQEIFDEYQDDFLMDLSPDVPYTVQLTLLYQEELMGGLMEFSSSEFDDDDDDPFTDDDEEFFDAENFIPHGKNIIDGNIESEEDMLKMIKEVMERMEGDGDDNTPLRLLPQKKGNKRKQ